MMTGPEAMRFTVLHTVCSQSTVECLLRKTDAFDDDVSTLACVGLSYHHSILCSCSFNILLSNPSILYSIHWAIHIYV
jgi:hypothetical protein